MLKKALLAGVVGAIASVGVAHANPFVGTGSLTIWNAATSGSSIGSSNQLGSAINPIATSGNLVFSGTYAGPINFADPAGGTDTITGFLATDPGFTATGTQSGTGLGSTLSSGGFSVVSLFDFTFTLTSAVTATIVHDDGISIWNSANTTDVFDSSTPTSATPSTVTLGAGTYNLWYAEANGLPADLIFNVPEPASLALLGAGLVGLGMVRRRSAKNASTAA